MIDFPPSFPNGADIEVICGAKTKTRGGKPCANPAGLRTSHFGQGKCYLHGGLQDGDKRLTTGRYSIERGGINHPRLADLYERYKDDPDPLHLFDEIALLRALTVDYIERHAYLTEALLAWYADVELLRRPLPEALAARVRAAFMDWGEMAVLDTSPEAEGARAVYAVLQGERAHSAPRQLPDLAEATNLVEGIGKMVERIERMRSRNAISEAELNRIIMAMSRTVDLVINSLPIDDPTRDTAKSRILDAWLQLVTR